MTLGKAERQFDILDENRGTRPDPTVVICTDEFGPLNLQPH